MTEPKAGSPSRRLLISVDMEKYSARDNRGQWEAQQAFATVMETAVRTAGLDRSKWVTQQAGDSELAILPPDVVEPDVVGVLATRLDELLREYNRGRSREARVRLRMAVHEGPVHLDGANGFPGTAVNTVCRLRDARVLKDVFAIFPEANVALVVSERIHEDLIREGYHGIRADRFRRVQVRDGEKDFASDAWISIVGEDLSYVALPDRDGPEPREARRGAEGTPRGNPGHRANIGVLGSGNSGITIGNVGDGARKVVVHQPPSREDALRMELQRLLVLLDAYADQVTGTDEEYDDAVADLELAVKGEKVRMGRLRSSLRSIVSFANGVNAIGAAVERVSALLKAEGGAG